MALRPAVAPRPEQSPERLDQIPSSERVVVPERTVEQAPHAEHAQEAPSGVRPQPAAPARPAPMMPMKSQTLAKIESIMEEDLADAFVRMHPDQQLAFKRAGEQAAKQIETLLRKTQVNIRKIVATLIGWLKLLPGANRFFVEQEAKIKAEKIISLQQK